MALSNTRYLDTGSKRFGVIEITKSPDGLWRDRQGLIFAVRDDETTADVVDRCGIGPLSLPEAIDWCKYHEYMYSSRAYQTFNTREEADKHLKDTVAKRSHVYVLGQLFKWISSKFGAKYWEVKETK